MSVELIDDLLRITIDNESLDIQLQTPNLQKLQEKINNLVVSLQENNFDWKSNNNLLVFETVTASIGVLKMIKKYKKLSVENKKDICFKIVEKCIEEEIDKLEITDQMKLLAQHGVDTIIEPIIELSILTLFQKTNAILKLCPCLKSN